MNVLDICSGISAASLAWGPIGWRTVAFSEIDPFACALLKHRYPDVPNWGDMTKFEEWPDADVDVLCGGTPCQSYSLAGNRAGLDDPRGDLMLTFGAIARRYRPRWLVWENVPGVLSSWSDEKDEAGHETGWQRSDFDTFLSMLAGLGYGVAYRVLDAQYFGLAQRRKRVFVVGYLGDWRRAAAVLFERHSLCGDPAPRRGETQDVAGTVAGGARERGGFSYDDIPQVVAGTVTAGMARRSAEDPERGLLVAAFGGNNTSGPRESAAALSAKGGSGRMDFETETFIVQSQPIPFDTTQITSATNRSDPKPGDPCHTLARGAHAPAIAFDARQDPCSSAETFGALGATSPQAQAVSYTTKLHNTKSNNAGKVFEERSPGLQANSPPPALITASQVRRLTPTECERLMGMPDGYTRIPYPGKKPAKDGPRYKALGNSWAVPVVEWIGRRIQAVDAIKDQT